MKKAINIVITFTIIATGIIGFLRLRYFERSAWIFKTGNEQAFQNVRGNRGGFERREFRPRPEDFSEGERPDLSNLPDSVQQRIMAERNARNENNTLREGRSESIPDGRGEFSERRLDSDGRRGHDFRRGSDVRLGNVGWFLAVFAGFTLITVYLENFVRAFKQSRKSTIKK